MKLFWYIKMAIDRLSQNLIFWIHERKNTVEIINDLKEEVQDLEDQVSQLEEDLDCSQDEMMTDLKRERKKFNDLFKIIVEDNDIILEYKKTTITDLKRLIAD